MPSFARGWAVGDSSATTVRGVVVFFGAAVDLRMSILRGAVRLSSGSPEQERWFTEERHAIHDDGEIGGSVHKLNLY